MFYKDGHMAKSEKYKVKMGKYMILMKMEFAVITLIQQKMNGIER